MVFLIDALFILYTLSLIMITTFTLAVCGCRATRQQSVCPVREVTSSMRVAPPSDYTTFDSTRTALDKSKKNGSHKMAKSNDSSIKVSKKKSKKGKKSGKNAKTKSDSGPRLNKSNENLNVKAALVTEQTPPINPIARSKEYPKSAATQKSKSTLKSVSGVDPTATSTQVLISQEIPATKDAHLPSFSPGASPGGGEKTSSKKDQNARSVHIVVGGATKSVPAF